MKQSQMFMTDEIGEGCDVIQVLSISVVWLRSALQNTEQPEGPVGAGGNGTQGLLHKLPIPLRIPPDSLLGSQTSSTSAQGLVCTLCCDTRVTQCKWSDLRVKVFFFLAEREWGWRWFFLWFTVFFAAQGLILAPFFNKFMPTRFFKSSHVRPSPL